MTKKAGVMSLGVGQGLVVKAKVEVEVKNQVAAVIDLK